MNILYLLNSLVSLYAVFLLIYGFFKHYSSEQTKQAVRWFSILFFCFLLLLVLSLFWFFNVMGYSDIDYLLVYSSIVFVQTVVLFKVNSLISRKNKYQYLASYLILFLLVSSFILMHLLFIFLLLSFFLTLLISFNFISISRAFKRAGYLGIIYSSFSLLSVFFLFLNVGTLFLYGLISTVLFVIFIFFFLRDITRYPVISSTVVHTKIESRFLLFIKYFVYIIVITNFVLISTIGVHELSHVAVARYYGCESRVIAFEENSYPYSEIVCTDLSHRTLITLAGPLLPVFIALLLFLLSPTFMMPLSFLMIGFNLLASYRDLIDLEVSPSLIVASSLVGLIFLFLGIAFLARTTVQERTVLL